MIRRAYCIVCGHLHRRDPETWTDRACCMCGAEVRFSSPPERVVLRLRLRLRKADLDLLGNKPICELGRLIREHIDKVRRRALKGAGVSTPTVGIELEMNPPPVRPRRRRQLRMFRDDETTEEPL